MATNVCLISTRLIIRSCKEDQSQNHKSHLLDIRFSDHTVALKRRTLALCRCPLSTFYPCASTKTLVIKSTKLYTLPKKRSRFKSDSIIGPPDIYPVHVGGVDLFAVLAPSGSLVLFDNPLQSLWRCYVEFAPWCFLPFQGE